ncbi:SGNH/GDSL hydrolase family protein [Paenibacillus lautus]|uniref:GDSL family lipase n=1 Tax=Paenibacillus lautus TaxID=1401 RepID=A0A385TYY1_PAELA|nr:SGNH/GDSL hydrolase family protein [Paenibacillus lautus]AYB47732.1 GDSL family lipase [Paenibacillus lautus]
MKFDFSTSSLRHGLFHQEPDGISCFLPGSALTVRFQGREITAEIEDVNGEGKSWLNVYIDDLPVRVMRIDPDNRLYQLADDLEDAPHTLTLQKRTEAAFGSIKFTDLTTENGAFLSPPAPLPHRLLIIGDSITCGFGNEAQIPCDCDASRENIALAYSSLTGQLLKAETLIVGASGTGCYQNFGGGKEGRMSDYFMKIICPDLDQEAMDPFHPEFVVVNLGTNDWSAPIEPADYLEQYRKLTGFIRNRYPSVPLFCAIGPMTLCPAPHLKALVKSLNEEGDDNIHFVEFPLIKRPEDGMGGCGHPSVKKHRQMAEHLAATIRQVCSLPPPSPVTART